MLCTLCIILTVCVRLMQALNFMLCTLCTVLTVCVRLMQAVDHPYLVVHSASAPGAAEAQKKLLEEEAQGLMQGTCGVCHDHLEDPVMSACQHVFCRACMMEYMEGAQGQAKCPSCEKPLSVDLSASAAVSSS